MRPYIKLFATGKPTGKINYIFYRHTDGQCFNLGSLCHTKGKRILFFPGFQARDLLWLVNKKGDYKKFNLLDFTIDHFTLEKDFKKLHLTLLKKDKRNEKTYPVSFRTFRLGEDLFFWFGLSIQDPCLLEPTPRKTTITFQIPPTDSKRRINNVINARQKSVFHIVELSQKHSFSKNEFIHFNFFICPEGFDIPKKHVFLSLPSKEPVVSNFYSETMVPYRAHYVALPKFDKKIAVLVSRHIGKLSNSILTAMYEDDEKV